MATYSPAQGTTRQYWIFQAKPTDIDLLGSLRTEALETFPVQQHQQRIQLGDQVIIWQTGSEAGCYALATVTTPVTVQPPTQQEADYWKAYTEPGPRVGVRLLANLWNRPLTTEALTAFPAFARFNGGRPGLNYRATAAQYQTIEELLTALEALEEEVTDYGLERPWLNPPLNQILYGPPGTGKTYQTVIHALSIIENRTLEELALEDRKQLRQRFEQYLTDGQIGFVTFHQSFTYEDFVEGIKPVTNKGQVTYELRNGIFKLMAQEARHCLLQTLYAGQPEAAREVSFSELYSGFLAHLRDNSFAGFQMEGRRFFLQRVLRFGNLSLRPDKSFAPLTLYKSTLQRLYQYYPGQPELSTLQHIAPLVGDTHASAYHAVLLALQEWERQQVSLAPAANDDTQTIELPQIDADVLHRCRRYVLIIDEINRGNVAAILGELITLLEADKREGQAEALAVVLPYSQTYFSVPANLYVVATMNTVDRSAEALDLALRRRFFWRAMPPQPALIGQLAAQTHPAGIDLERLLRTINQRLTLLLGEDYQIGHAYLLDIQDLDDLRAVFEFQLLPLLRDYFLDDLRKIGLVLGRAFLQPLSETDVLADFDYPLTTDWSDSGATYQLKSISELTAPDFITIYQRS